MHPQITFTPKTDVQEYLYNALNYDIYSALTKSGLWKDAYEPLDFLNLLYERFDWILKNLSRPIDVRNGLLDLQLADKPHYLLLDCLLKLIYAEAEPVFGKVSTTSNIFPSGYELFDYSAKLFAYDQFRKLGNDAHNQDKRSLYLIFMVINEEQDRVKRQSTLTLPTSYNTHIDIDEEEVSSGLKLSDRRGAKTDVIRIFSAMFDLHLIETTDGSELTKEKFMTILGNFLGEDFSNYAQSLSLALKASPEAHLKIFRQLEVKAKSQWEAILQKDKK